MSRIRFVQAINNAHSSRFSRLFWAMKFLVFINLKEMFSKAFFHQMNWRYFLQISNSLYRLLKTAVFVMMKISTEDRSIINFLQASLIKQTKEDFLH
jgi:TRAP-type mannitol/chloroaromatic compound transport system permease large subunit